MFARKKENKRSSLRDHSGLGALAAYVLTPSPTKASQVGIEPSLDVHRYQKGLEPAQSPKPTRAGAKELFYSSGSTNTTAESSLSSVQPTRLNRTGDKSSFTLSDHDNVYIDRNAARKGYRVVSYKITKSGKRKVFDILDGKTYHCGAGVQRRITDNAIVFATKQEALSERFPSNQVKHNCDLRTKCSRVFKLTTILFRPKYAQQFEASKAGNGRHPRMLLSFGKLYYLLLLTPFLRL